jgi:aspartyl-tRNA(Asn)/glutamyl-tRNA(Gln) amidotransferase subunit A
MSLDNLGLFEISKKLHAKEMSSEDITRSYLKRIEQIDPKLNSFITVNEQALDLAKQADNKRAKGDIAGPLMGVPYAAKDMFCTKGLRTTAASKILSNFIPPYSATVIKKLEDQGMVLLGKTNQDEFAMGSSNETSAFGCSKNPWNTDYVPGGSSGGSASAVAARLTPLALGTDTGGSIRQPAHFCGITGIKPTYGRISRYGVVSFASSLDQAGPMTLKVKDSALALEFMSGYDAADSTSAKKEIPQWSEKISTNLKGLKVGLVKQYIEKQLDPEIQKAWSLSQESLKSQGVEFVEVDISLSEHAIPVYYLVATSEASSNLSRYDGIRYGQRSDFEALPAESIDDFYARSRGEGFGDEVKRRILLGTFSLSAGYFDAYYIKACQVRRLLQQQYLQAFEKCDVLLSPVASTSAFKIGEKVNDPLKMFLNDFFTTATNLCGLPGLTVPVMKNDLGLPIGIQLTGKPFDEQSLFNVGQALEDQFAFHKELPNGI